MQRPTLRQLEYFTAVARTLNFRQAAEECYVTQPALSTQIQQLEELLGVALFERDKRRTLLTPAGRALSSSAEEILVSVDRLAEIAHSFGEPLSGELRLGVIPTIGSYLLPKVLRAVREAYPELRLLLREDQTARIVQQLDRGQLDVLLVALDVDLGGAEEHFLFNDPFLVACKREHPLAELELVKESDLEGQTTLLLDEGHCLRAHAMPICKRAGTSELADFRASSLGTLVQMVDSGLGITLLPEMAVERELASAPSVVTRPFDAEGPGRRIGLAWRKASSRGEEFEALGKTITRAYLDA